MPDAAVPDATVPDAAVPDAAAWDAVINDASSIDAAGEDATPDACVAQPLEICGDSLDNDCNAGVDDGCLLGGSLLWAKRAGGIVQDQTGVAIQAANDGAAVVVGRQLGTAVFGAGEANETTLNGLTAHSPVGFVARYTSAGQLAWARRAVTMNGATGDIRPSGITLLADGGYVVVGSVTCDVIVGPDGTSPITAPGGTNQRQFIARFDSGGNVTWVRFVVGQYGARADSVALNGNELVVVGIGMGSTVFNPGGADAQTLGSPGSATAQSYVAWWDLNGGLQHVVPVTGFTSELRAVVPRADGRVIIGGLTLGPITIGTTPGAIELSPSYTAVFAVTFDPNRQPESARVLASGSVIHTAMTVADDSLYIVGSMNQDVTFSPGEPGELSISDSGAFLARFSLTGDVLWVRRGSSASAQAVYNGVVATAGGGVAVTGWTGNTTTFNAGEPDEQTIVPGFSSRAIIVARYDEQGGLSWLQAAYGSGAYNGGRAIAARPDGNLVITGQFNGTVTFGATQLNQTSLTSFGVGSIFTAVYAP